LPAAVAYAAESGSCPQGGSCAAFPPSAPTTTTSAAGTPPAALTSSVPAAPSPPPPNEARLPTAGCLCPCGATIESKRDDEHSTRITVLAFGALTSWPVFGASAELGITPDIGVAALFGYSRETAFDDVGERHTTDFFQVGVSGAWYPFGDLKELRLGFDGTYTAGDDPMPATSDGRVGPAFDGYVGYKPVATSGFTFLADAGVGYHLGTSETDGTWYTLFRLGIGWSSF
jgi:hypothetical protein